MIGFALRPISRVLAVFVATHLLDDALDGSTALSDANLVVDDFPVYFVYQR